MLHYLPQSVISSVRLISQFLGVLKFGESQDPIARRVFFEAWFCACSILSYQWDFVVSASTTAVATTTANPSTKPEIAALCDALTKAIEGWGKSLELPSKRSSQTNPIQGTKSQNRALEAFLGVPVIDLLPSYQAQVAMAVRKLQLLKRSVMPRW